MPESEEQVASILRRLQIGKCCYGEKKARELLLNKLVSNKSHAEKIQLGNGSGLEFQFQPRILYGS